LYLVFSSDTFIYSNEVPIVKLLTHTTHNMKVLIQRLLLKFL